MNSALFRPFKSQFFLANAHFEGKVIRATRAWYKKVAATDISIECAF
jgi:hypothetical protein